MIDFKKLQAAAIAIAEAGENVIYPDERSLSQEEEPALKETPPPAPVMPPAPAATPAPNASQKPEWLAELEAASEKRQAEMTADRLPMQASNDDMATEPLVGAPMKTAMAQFAPESHPAANDHAHRRFNAAAKSALDMFQLNKADGEDESQIYTAKRLFRHITFTAIPPAMLKTATDDSLAAEGMVAHALSQGWSPIRIEGTDAFKAHAFLHAVRMGAEVAGYEPTGHDIEAINRAGLAMPEWVVGNQISPAATETPAFTGRKAPRQPAMGM